MGLKMKEEDTLKADKNWLLVLAYIGAKRTHEPEFRELFERMVQEGHQQARTLSMLYDFTPIRAVIEETSYQAPPTR